MLLQDVRNKMLEALADEGERILYMSPKEIFTLVWDKVMKSSHQETKDYFMKLTDDDIKQFLDIVDAPTQQTLHNLQSTQEQALQMIVEYGIKVIPCREDGSFICTKEQYDNYLTSDADTIKNYMKNGYPIFRFCPKDYGLLIVDIDVGHSNGIDGVESFYNFCKQTGLPKSALPKDMQDIENGTFPAYVTTPSGGLHLYFKHSGKDITKQKLCENVEIFNVNYINSAVSVKNGKPYVFYGNLDEAPTFPPLLLERIKSATTQSPATADIPTYPVKSYYKVSCHYNQDQCFEYAMLDHPNCSGKNEKCFYHALRAKNEGYIENEIIGFLKNNPETSGHKQIESTVRSAFRYRK